MVFVRPTSGSSCGRRMSRTKENSKIDIKFHEIHDED